MANIEKAGLKIATAHELGETLRAKHDAAQVQEQRAAGGERASTTVAKNIEQLTTLLASEIAKGLPDDKSADGIVSFVTRYLARAQGIANSMASTEGARKVMAAGMVAAFREALKAPAAMIAAEQRKAEAATVKAEAGKRSFSADVDETKPEATPAPSPKKAKRKSRKKTARKPPKD